MTSPLSMFEEKNATGTAQFSMTRTVSFIFALTVCYAIVLYARAGKDLVWPFVALGIVTLLAVPLQALCKWLQQWLATSPGQAVLASLAEKVTGKIEGKMDGHEHGEDR